MRVGYCAGDGWHQRKIQVIVFGHRGLQLSVSRKKSRLPFSVCFPRNTLGLFVGET